jgi:hypothetical protein
MISLRIMWQMRQLTMRFIPLCKCHEVTYPTLLCNMIMSRCSCYNNKKCCDLILRPWGHYDNHYIWRLLWLNQPSSRNRLTEKVYIGYAIRSRLRSVNQERDFLIQVTEDTLGPLNEIHPMLQHVTRSRGWNITGMSWIAISVTRLNQV